jgi:WD40 repeat protein
MRCLKDSTRYVDRMVFSPDGNHLASCNRPLGSHDYDPEIRLWDVTTGRCATLKGTGGG